MSKITVHKAEMPVSAAVNPFFMEVDETLEAVRRRAFELFECRSGAPGDPVDDWLQAERDLFLIPAAEIAETADGFSIKLTITGFEAGYIDVLARPEVIVVLAKNRVCSAKHKNDETCANCAGESRSLYRRFDLPAPVDVNSVKADIDKGILTIRARKSVPEKPAKTSRQSSHQPVEALCAAA